ncbi:MAG: ABC transporter ATP-binding protein [Lachnospiraceae bacterium]|nr:ABC transporter ATP-binding protein [Lachnospiraceae bacterium]
MTMRFDKKVIRRILHYLKPYWFFMLCSLLFAAVSALLALYLPVLTGQAVDIVIGKGRVDMEAIKSVIFKMLCIIGISALGQWIMNACNNHVAYCSVRDIRHSAFERLQKLPLSYMDSHPTGDILSRMIADVDTFADGLLMGFTQFFTGILTIIGTLILMVSIHKWVALVVILLTPLSLFVAAFIAKNTSSFFKQQSVTKGVQTTIIDEMIGNEKLVKAFSHEAEAEELFNKNNAELEKISLKAVFFSSLTNPSTRFVNNLIYALVALAGGIAVIRGHMSVGNLTAFLSYANQYTKPFNEISGVVTELQNAITCAGRVFELIDEEARTPDKEDAAVLEGAKGGLDIKNVSFSYVKDKPLLRDLNLKVTPGQRVAIVGPTGCGKTTLINLLMRFYDVDKGSIAVDGRDIRDYTRHSLRENYGMVLQETWLKPGTIRDNITLGKPDATDEEVIAAAKNSHAHSFIMQLPKQYDTVIGEDGGQLSQGQKQLICISRIMLSLPPMLILDEATSSIDTRTELKIQDAFARMMKGRTSFIVAHRLSTIKEADTILVMKDGNIIEQGDHKSLLSAGGFYSKLYRSQYEI